MNPDIPQEVRIVNAIAEQLFDVWPVSIVMIDLEDRIWRVNKQMSDELQLDTDIIGKSVFDLLEVVQDKQNVLPRYLQELHEGCQRIIPLSSNCFIYEQKRHISFLIQGALIGVYEEERLVRIVLYYRNVLEERTQKRLLNIALSRTQIFQWSYDLERNLMIIDPRYFEYLGIPTRDYTLTPEEFAYLIHPDDRQSVFDALTLQLDGNLYDINCSCMAIRSFGVPRTENSMQARVRDSHSSSGIRPVRRLMASIFMPCSARIRVTADI